MSRHAGYEVKRARVHAGLTQVELAAKLGITQHRLSEIESADRLSDETLDRVETALGIRLEVE